MIYERRAHTMTGGITLILVLALMGGLIAYLGDKLGS